MLENGKIIGKIASTIQVSCKRNLFIQKWREIQGRKERKQNFVEEFVSMRMVHL